MYKVKAMVFVRLSDTSLKVPKSDTCLSTMPSTNAFPHSTVNAVWRKGHIKFLFTNVFTCVCDA